MRPVCRKRDPGKETQEKRPRKRDPGKETQEKRPRKRDPGKETYKYKNFEQI